MAAPHWMSTTIRAGLPTKRVCFGMITSHVCLGRVGLGRDRNGWICYAVETAAEGPGGTRPRRTGIGVAGLGQPDAAHRRARERFEHDSVREQRRDVVARVVGRADLDDIHGD